MPYDAYDAKGKLLLRAGETLTSAAQVERLIRTAYFDDHGYSDGNHDQPSDPASANRPLALIVAARRRLQSLLDDAKGVDFVQETKRIGQMLHRACHANADLSLASIVLQRDGPYAIRHMVNTAIACELTGAVLGLSTAERASIMAAALTMNIGMLDLQQQLLSVKGPLNDEQNIAVQSHCQRGVALLQDRSVGDTVWLQAVQDHHERPDGSGYPAGKRGEEIGLPAHLLALADVYCARVAGRHYRPPLQPNLALRWLFLNDGAKVDAKIATLFIKTLSIYPPGTGVRLRNGSIGVVTHRGKNSLAPQVSSITTHDGLRVATPIRRRIDTDAHAISEVVDLEELDLAVSMEALWGKDAVI
nr:HD domain-containing phosphohydrolase [Dyella sp. RRB7]